MSLGRFLLRGISKKRKSQPLSRWGTPSRAKKKRAKKKLEQKPELKTEQKELAVVESPAVAAQPVQATHNQNQLLASSLIRADGENRKFIEAFLLEQRSEHTKKAYSKDLKRFFQFLHGQCHIKPVYLCDRMAIIAYREFLRADGLQDTSVDRHLATLRSFFQFLCEEGVCEKNPAEKVRFLKPKRFSTTQAFTNEEVVKVLVQPNLHTRIGAQHYAILMVLFYCGVRRSELCSLKTSNFSIERDQAIFRLQGKGNKERIIVITKPVWNALRYYFKITARDPSVDQYLFMPIRNNRTGVGIKPLDPSFIFYIVKKYAKLAGIQKPVSPHSCRATAISNARDHQVPDRAIQEFAGWSTPDMITRYDKRKSAIEQSAAHAIHYGDRDRTSWFQGAASSESGSIIKSSDTED